MSDNQILEIGEEEENFLNDSIELGMDIMAQYGVDQNLGVFENMDNCFNAWKNDENEKPSDDEISIGLGAVLGNRICNQTDFNWYIVNDEFGTELAIISESTSIQVYPIAFVAKRTEPDNDEDAIFTGIWGALQDKCKSL